ncbi:MAG: adenylate/guanylate cyclase domain-containing protein [Alphaproteobacteria bacterium]|nr:adenylate/guanylate cyclase domain-containing protein [Alphaproteobacteria bacterium]
MAAIVAADVVGYSRLVGRDESGTVARLRKNRAERLDPVLARRGGRLVKLTGDGALIEFASAVEALSACIEFQQSMVEANIGVPTDSALLFRVGLHLGDLIVDGDDLYGDGVNVAARLEATAPPGGIVISRTVHESVAGRVKATLEDLGALELKNIERPVQAYVVKWDPGDWKTAAAAQPVQPGVEPPGSPGAPLLLPDKPSIAVLPFQNMSGDPEQEYFADGVAEDVLTTLSKIEELMVIARNSSFVFKGQSKDVREIGRILGVRYVLEGSVRKSGNRVRLTAQLIDSLDGSHVWADRFDGDLDDVFALQDRITQDIVSALEVRLTLGEQARVWLKRSGSPMVYEHFSKAQSYYNQFGKHTHAQAKEACERALAINPGYTPVLLFLGFTLVDQARFGWVADAAAAYKASLECADRALQADPESSEGYMIKGYACTFLRRHDEATEAGQKAIALSPSSGGAYHMAGMFYGYACDFRKAAAYEQQAQRLSPLSMPHSMVDEARVRFHLGEFVAARDISLRVLKTRKRWLTAQTTLVAALWSLGTEDEARSAAKELLVEHPNFSISRWALGLPYKREEYLEALIGPLRLAGLPD